jgi:DNA-binding HxlR family transcriptional regulator
MRRTRFDDWPCPIARTTDLLGDWWTPLVMRQAFQGQRRFEDIQRALDIPRAVLTQRLARLVEEGLMERRRYEEHPPRDEYRLTEKGFAFFDVLGAMWRYGEDWLFEPAGDGGTTNPVMLVDKETGDEVRPQVIDATTGNPLDVRRVRLVPRASTSPTRSG